MNGQISNSKKSEMSNWAKQYSYQLTAEQIQAVENNDCSKFKTTSGGKTTMSQIWKEQPFGDCFGQKYAESYDEASWFRARCAFLEYRNSELERENDEEEDEENEDRIVVCSVCGETKPKDVEWRVQIVFQKNLEPYTPYTPAPEDFRGEVICPECDSEDEE